VHPWRRRSLASLRLGQWHPLLKKLESMETQHRKRVQHYNDPGHAHELTFTCQGRLPLLNRDPTRQWLVESIDRVRRELNYGVLAYVIMPEHVHLLVWPKEQDYNISHFLKRVKQSVSRRAKTWLVENDPAWLKKLIIKNKDGQKEFRFWLSGGGYDRNVTSKEALGEMIQYIHNNPVRRGLAKKPTDWQWSSSSWHEEGRKGPLEIDPLDEL
jgi:putative transposase